MELLLMYAEFFFSISNSTPPDNIPLFPCVPWPCFFLISVVYSSYCLCIVVELLSLLLLLLLLYWCMPSLYHRIVIVVLVAVIINVLERYLYEPCDIVIARAISLTTSLLQARSLWASRHHSRKSNKPCHIVVASAISPSLATSSLREWFLLVLRHHCRESYLLASQHRRREHDLISPTVIK